MQNSDRHFPKVSVIIPVYGVEKYIERCAASLLEQTLDGVEYIFVDDDSPDLSIEVLRRTIHRFPNQRSIVRIVAHETNRGLPAARNTGISIATGEYIFHCDSDDYLEPDMLEMMYMAAKHIDADYVWCDWYLTFGRNERLMCEPDFTEPVGYLKGMLAGCAKYNVWNKLVKKSLYDRLSIKFPEGHSMGEDMTMICLAACAEKVYHVAHPLYHYVKREGEAFTNSLNPSKLADIRVNVDNTIAFIGNRFGESISEEIAFFKLSTKFPFLMSDDINWYRLWNEWYPEASSYIWRNPYASLRKKILETAARRKFYLILKVYYKLVYSFIYGVIFR